MTPRVVITGVGAVRANGSQVVDFDASKLPEAKSLRRAATHVLYGIGAASAALRDATPVAPEEMGLVCVSALGSTNFSYRLWRDLLKSGPAGASPVLFSEGVPNALAGHVARTLRLLGPVHMLGGGSDAGLRALAIARDLLTCGRARRVVVVAAEEISELAQRAYRRFRLGGLAQSEGAAALVVELDAGRGGAARPAALATLLAVESVQLMRRSRAEDAAELAAFTQRTLAAAGLSARDVDWPEPAVDGPCGDALTVTPLLQTIDALPQVAEGRRAAIVSRSPFSAATLLILGPA